MYQSHGVLTELWLFIKRHIVICVLCLICGLAVAKYSNLPIPSWLPNFIQVLLLRPQDNTTVFECWEILNNLSLAFVASIITYVVVQYIPERRKAYNAFIILKNYFEDLYSDMSHLIDMHLFNIGIKEPEKKVKLKQLSAMCNIELKDEMNNCKIISLLNGKNGNEVNYGYKLFKDSKKYAESIQKTIEKIKESIYCTQLDSEILERLSEIETNAFLVSFLKMKAEYIDIPGSQALYYKFDEKFYEFIEHHLFWKAYRFNKYSYIYTEISAEELALKNEERLFMSNRVVFSIMGTASIKNVSEGITALEPNENRLRKSVGVLLEILTFYDFDSQKSKETLQAALKLSEYIRKNAKDKVDKNYSFLNSMQIRKRQNNLSSRNIIKLKSIISEPNTPDDILLGASIICGDYEKAEHIFELLSEEKKKFFVDLPIYHLWPNPPVKANPKPRSFLII